MSALREALAASQQQLASARTEAKASAATCARLAARLHEHRQPVRPAEVLTQAEQEEALQAGLVLKRKRERFQLLQRHSMQGMAQLWAEPPPPAPPGAARPPSRRLAEQPEALVGAATQAAVALPRAAVVLPRADLPLRATLVPSALPRQALLQHVTPRMSLAALQLEEDAPSMPAPYGLSVTPHKKRTLPLP